MGAGWSGACTLLGPEGPDVHALGVWGWFLQAFAEAGFAGGGGGSDRLLRTT